MKFFKPAWVSHDGNPIFSVDIHPDGFRFATGGQGKNLTYFTRLCLFLNLLVANNSFMANNSTQVLRSADELSSGIWRQSYHPKMKANPTYPRSCAKWTTTWPA